ncbi:amidase domain-containing protein [Agromyces sp. Marseille-Q5079]|uniref:amidase domain-containing protein n=1 Tax=Agromyces sp. Marseille-Q5079 TaxID=3439059 RepID=UPI003D9CB8DF
MLNPSDLPVLRRATFRAPVLETEPDHDASKRRRRSRSKRSSGGRTTAPTLESTAESEIDAVAPLESAAEPEFVVEVEPVAEVESAAEFEFELASEPESVPEAEAGDASEAEAATEATAEQRGSHVPRHRAERVRNRRAASVNPSGKGAGKGAGVAARRTAAFGTAAAFIGLSAFGALIPADAETADTVAQSSSELSSDSIATITEATKAATKDSITPAVVADPGPAITSGLSTAAAPFTGGAQVTVQGRALDEVASVAVGATPATIVAADDTQITFQVPAVAQASTGAAVDITMTDAEGDPVDVVTTEAPASSVAGLISEVAAIDGKDGQAVGEKAADPLTFTYTSDPGIDAQLAYVATYWSSYNSAQYPVFSGVDCANFASQSLIARGWAMDGGWFYDGSTGTMSSSWSSSTALRDYLLSQPARATALDDSQRAQVKVGDIAQFDWDNSGDRDHTAVVTRVEQTDAGTKVWVGGHTKDIDYWDVDEALASGGGSVTYFSIH